MLNGIVSENQISKYWTDGSYIKLEDDDEDNPLADVISYNCGTDRGHSALTVVENGVVTDYQISKWGEHSRMKHEYDDSPYYVSSGLDMEYYVLYDELTPNTPQNLDITGSIGQNPTLSWNSAYYAVSYYIYRKRETASTWSYIDSTTSLSYTDNDATILSPRDPDAIKYIYHVKAHNEAGLSGASNNRSIWGEVFKTSFAQETILPITTLLHSNYPNPFNAETNIRFQISQSVQVKLTVFDITGKEIAELLNKNLHAGYHEVNWNAEKISSGTYIYRLKAGNTTITKKMVLLK